MMNNLKLRCRSAAKIDARDAEIILGERPAR
jgi:hypothetical protein